MGLLCSNLVFLFSCSLILSFFPNSFPSFFLAFFFFHILSVYLFLSSCFFIFIFTPLPVQTTVTEYTYHSWLEHLSFTVPGGNYSLFLESICEYHSNISQSCFTGGNHAVSIRAEPCLRSKWSLGQPSLSLPFVEHEDFLSYHVHYGLTLDRIRQHIFTPSNHLYLETILILILQSLSRSHKLIIWVV